MCAEKTETRLDVCCRVNGELGGASGDHATSLEFLWVTLALYATATQDFLAQWPGLVTKVRDRSEQVSLVQHKSVTQIYIIRSLVIGYQCKFSATLVVYTTELVIGKIPSPRVSF